MGAGVLGWLASGALGLSVVLHLAGARRPRACWLQAGLGAACAALFVAAAQAFGASWLVAASLALACAAVGALRGASAAEGAPADGAATKAPTEPAEPMAKILPFPARPRNAPASHDAERRREDRPSRIVEIHKTKPPRPLFEREDPNDGCVEENVPPRDA